ncbi:MAG TPA: class I adenylate-forming enzyme family protein, partial [Bacteroidales bacterium]|nr:class I adenylate-forming enzyme family protein [Bacteroidales bacterium]HQC59867.1 class I adenylate-forming enzyme family protein [Bacteroidales bacterium]
METCKDVRQLIIEAAENFGHKTAYVYNDQEYCFMNLKDSVFRLANSLLDMGYKKGDKLAIYLPNCIEYVYSYYAIYSLGLVAVPIDFYFNPQEVFSIGKHCELKGIITTTNAKFNLLELKQNIPSLRDIITIEENAKYLSFWKLASNSKADLEDQGIYTNMMSSIFYTSGSSGKPKGATWNYEHIHLGAEQLKMMTEFEGLKGILMMDETERIISAIPFSHSGGILFPMSAIKYGVSTVIMPKYHPLD